MLRLARQSRQQHLLEFALLSVCLGLCCLLDRLGSHRLVVLHLFQLPVILAAFFLGRYLAGVLTLLCVTSAAVVLATDLQLGLSGADASLALGLTLATWGAALGLTAILAGTLCDERAQKALELHDVYVGVLEVLSHYLNSADPRRRDRAAVAAQLGGEVAARMHLA